MHDLSMLYLNGNSIGNEGTKAIITEAIKDNKVWISLFLKWNLNKNCIHKVNTNLNIEKITTILSSMMMISLVNATGRARRKSYEASELCCKENSLQFFCYGRTSKECYCARIWLFNAWELGCELQQQSDNCCKSRYHYNSVCYEYRMILCSTLWLHSTSEIGCEYWQKQVDDCCRRWYHYNLTLTLASGEKSNGLITFWQLH